METKISPHAGHRKRIRERIEKTNEYQLGDLEFLENLLTFILPRVDTKPIAKALLAEFLTIEAIFNAPEDALLCVDGIGPKTAYFLKYMSTVCYMGNRSKATEKPYVGTFSTAIPFLKQILPWSNNEQMAVLIINKLLEVKLYKIYTGKTETDVNVDIDDIVEYLANNNAEYCLFAHTHPKDSTPSQADKYAFYKTASILTGINVKIIDNLILGKDNFFSLRQNKEFSYVNSDYDYKTGKLFVSNNNDWIYQD